MQDTPSLPPELVSSAIRHGYRFKLELDARDASAFTHTATPTAGETGGRSFRGDGFGGIFTTPGELLVTSLDRTSCNPELTPLGRR